MQPLWQTGQPTQEDAIAAEMGGEAPPKKKKRRLPCSRRSGKKDRMTDNQRAMHRRRDADGDDGGASRGHFGSAKELALTNLRAVGWAIGFRNGARATNPGHKPGPATSNH